MPLKTVNVLGVLQISALTACYVFLNWMAKLYEKTGSDLDYISLNEWLNKMAGFKVLTLAMLLVPVVTAGFCMVRAKVSRGVQWLGPHATMVLVIVTVGIWIFSFVLSLHALAGPPVRRMVFQG